MSKFRPGLNAEKIKNEISPTIFYQSVLRNIKLDRYDWNEAGLCPFHNDRKAGSFFVNVNSGAFNCFSCGAKGSDIIAFTKQHYDLSFVDALKKLQADWGLL
ncbi:CHC2 zinc finger domain-containing protein [Methylomonas sp. MED-D]|uniref:CHC2 zinc finger domain-containing protein n=1 Tax=unclassified Methylomonas TaxID=2608980 RepID=UPI0028A42B04|nr:CHC2 zinc finger domain-containing protein [Methylomonas sp. MV1]MDT4330825.1 CHC2 zinc finger domain-containing protein [Methylomonas sp. MV1]